MKFLSSPGLWLPSSQDSFRTDIHTSVPVGFFLEYLHILAMHSTEWGREKKKYTQDLTYRVVCKLILKYITAGVEQARYPKTRELASGKQRGG